MSFGLRNNKWKVKSERILAKNQNLPGLKPQPDREGETTSDSPRSPLIWVALRSLSNFQNQLNFPLNLSPSIRKHFSAISLQDIEKSLNKVTGKKVRLLRRAQNRKNKTHLNFKQNKALLKSTINLRFQRLRPIYQVSMIFSK